MVQISEIYVFSKKNDDNFTKSYQITILTSGTVQCTFGGKSLNGGCTNLLTRVYALMGGGQLPHFYIIASNDAILGPEGLKVI